MGNVLANRKQTLSVGNISLPVNKRTSSLRSLFPESSIIFENFTDLLKWFRGLFDQYMASAKFTRRGVGNLEPSNNTAFVNPFGRSRTFTRANQVLVAAALTNTALIFDA